MLRCAVSMASATPSPHDQTWWRKARVASQSISAGSPGRVVGERLRHDVRGRVGDAARERMPRLRERRRLRERHGAQGAGAVDEGDRGHGQRAPVSSADCSTRACGIRSARGIRRRDVERDDGQVDAAALGGRAQALLGEEHAAGAGEEVVVVGGVLDDVADELLPLRLEAVLEHVVAGDLDPVAVVVVRVGEVGVPHRLRGGVARLDLAAEEARRPPSRACRRPGTRRARRG